MRVQLTAASVLALAPLLILPGWFSSYDVTPKIAIVLIGAALGLIFFLRNSGAQLRRLWADPLGRWFCILAAAQILVPLLATVASSHPALAWSGGNWRRLGFVSQSSVLALAFLIAASTSQSGLRILLRAITVAGTVVAVYGILQYFGIDPFQPAAGYHVGEGVAAIVRPPSTLGHADYFAGYLLYVVFFGAAMAAKESQAVWKAVGLFAAIVGSIAIVLSGTRGALLGLALGAVTMWIWTRVRPTSRLVVIAASLCAAGLAFYFSPAGLQLRARTQWDKEDLRGGARLLLWRDSLRMAREKLPLGFGPDTFALEFPRHQSTELSRAYPDFYHESPHNIFLDALVSEGIPGLAILIGFIALAWFGVRRAISEGWGTAPFLGAAVISGLVAGIFVCFTLTGALFFYTTIAMIVASALRPAAAFAESRENAWIRVPAVALIGIFASIFVYFAIQSIATDAALARAKRYLDAGQIDASLQAYRQSQRWHPAGSSDDLYFSRALAMSSTHASTNDSLLARQQALILAQRATQSSEERQNAWYNLAGFYATANNARGAEMCLRRSIEASPNWFKPHWALAQVLALTGRRIDALAEAAQAANLDGGKDPEVAKFLQSLHHQLALSHTK